LILQNQALELEMQQTRPSHAAAILTGDLKGSTKASERDLNGTMDLLSEAATELTTWFNGNDTRFTRSRGDGWQMAILPPQYALRAALFLFARLTASEHALSTRIAIGIGQISSLGTRSLADASGSAFEYSGRSLDRMRGLTFLSIEGDGVTPFHRIIVRLLAERCLRWTREQAAAMALYLHPDNPTLKDLAPRFGISPQAVNYRLKGSAAVEMRLTLRDWEDAHYHEGFSQSSPDTEQTP
jgi:hypothetical protein